MDTKRMFGQMIGCGVAVSLLGMAMGWAAQPKIVPAVEQNGTIAAVSPGMVQLKTLTGQGWLFRLSQRTKIHVTGTADKSFLQRGVVVEFTATLDQKGHATSKVPKLTICNLSPQKLPGMFPEASGGLISEPPQPGSKKKKEPTGPVTYHITGPITQVKEGQYTVSTPHGTATFEVEEGAEIKVDMSVLMYARPGDRIAVKGAAFREGLGEAEEVVVELATPLTAPETGRSKKKYEKKTPEKTEEPVSEEKPEKPLPKKASQKKTEESP